MIQTNLSDKIQFRFQRRVRWRDTDASGWANMAAFITWMEETEYAFLRSRGLSVVLEDEKSRIGFPRLSSELSILSYAKHNEVLEVRLKLSEYDGKKFSYEFFIHNDRYELAVGRFTMACCRFPEDQMPKAILIPKWIEEKLLGQSLES